MYISVCACVCVLYIKLYVRLYIQLYIVIYSYVHYAHISNCTVLGHVNLQRIIETLVLSIRFEAADKSICVSLFSAREDCVHYMYVFGLQFLRSHLDDAR